MGKDVYKRQVGDVDISLYRDDLNTFLGDSSIENMNLGVEVRNKKVILVDDVLYTCLLYTS